MFEQYRKRINRALVEHVHSAVSLPSEARAAMLYSVGLGGKRLRPIIALLACQSVGGRLEDGMNVAVATELIHTATLLYDDILDKDDLRRGSPAVHIRFGMDLSMIVAGLMTFRAFQLMIRNRAMVKPAASVRNVVDALERLGNGAILELREHPSSVKSCLAVSESKTATMFRLAAELGGISGKGTRKQCAALSDYAGNLGIAFQLRDDVLDAVGKVELIGKPVWSDLRNGRPSIVSAFLCEQLGTTRQAIMNRAKSRRSAKLQREIAIAADRAMLLCDQYVSKASEALMKLPESAHRRDMQKVLRYAVNRDR